MDIYKNNYLYSNQNNFVNIVHLTEKLVNPVFKEENRFSSKSNNHVYFFLHDINFNNKCYKWLKKIKMQTSTHTYLQEKAKLA